MNVSRRSQQPRHLFLVRLHAVLPQPLKLYKKANGRPPLVFSASLCEPKGRGFSVCVQTEQLKAGFPGRMFLTAHFLIVLC